MASMTFSVIPHLTDEAISGGILLHYQAIGEKMDGLKDGILLEVGFDDITPNFLEPSIHGPMITPSAKCRSLTTAP